MFLSGPLTLSGDPEKRYGVWIEVKVLGQAAMSGTISH
jgi:hypothetical protein